MIQTPYYLIDEARLQQNMEKIALLRQLSGAKALLALKCFATWSVFDLMQQYMDGTTSSSLYEVRLGREKFGGETHAYSVAYGDNEIDEVVSHADKIIFNTVSQLQRFQAATSKLPRGLRLNPQVSNSPYLLADPSRPYSRLGEHDPARVAEVIDSISGFMIHNNCENHSFESFDTMLSRTEARFGHLIAQVEWVSLGGGIHFTGAGYPLERLAERLKAFAEQYGVQVYMEPGEAAISGSATLEVSVLDTLQNGKDIAIVDSSIEAHMLDLLIYSLPARIEPATGPHRYLVCGKSCLAGDIFGEFGFNAPLQPGDRLSIQDAAGYTMVKKNWFNGLAMPAIAVKRLTGATEIVKSFSYDDYAASLS